MDFSDFFRTERDQLLRFCWLLTLDADAAADLAQDVMERAYARWSELSMPGNNPAGWIRTVAVNLSRNRWRRLRRLAIRLPALLPADASVSTATDPDLAGALATLAPRQRQVIALRYWADLPLAECARTMNVSLGTVKQHLARAHQRLASTLDPLILEELAL